MKKAALISILGLTVAGMASAQSRTSFVTPTSWTGITITNSGPKNWNVALSGVPTITWNNQTYKVDDVFGFWLLDNNNDMSASGSNQGVWYYNQNYTGTGGIAGFKTNPNTGIKPGGNQSFTFKSVNGTVENVGIHARISLGSYCDTVYFECPPPAVPEPASLAALGIGAAAMIRRRRVKK